ncbi:MAG: hypothetical protein IIA40_10070, partial [SAR324 cluster bacterium]|nr:hypothetical protein [SAR324 cluster bacterium]
MTQSSTARKKVIIGIHGLANKPKEDVLYEYWRKSVEEGLKIVDQAFARDEEDGVVILVISGQIV